MKEHHFVAEIPIVQDVAHDDDVGMRERVFEEISGGKTQS
jgi:hypothetical protein